MLLILLASLSLINFKYTILLIEINCIFEIIHQIEISHHSAYYRIESKQTNLVSGPIYRLKPIAFMHIAHILCIYVP